MNNLPHFCTTILLFSYNKNYIKSVLCCIRWENKVGDFAKKLCRSTNSIVGEHEK